jgi:hypothetical protein
VDAVNAILFSLFSERFFSYLQNKWWFIIKSRHEREMATWERDQVGRYTVSQTLHHCAHRTRVALVSFTNQGTTTGSETEKMTRWNNISTFLVQLLKQGFWPPKVVIPCKKHLLTSLHLRTLSFLRSLRKRKTINIEQCLTQKMWKLWYRETFVLFWSKKARIRIRIRIELNAASRFDVTLIVPCRKKTRVEQMLNLNNM